MKTIEEYKAQSMIPPNGIPCQTEADIRISCAGFNVHEKHITARKSNALGMTSGIVPGAGDLWWVTHDDGSIGAYMSDEVTDIYKENT